jgi:heptosyltransferase II
MLVTGFARACLSFKIVRVAAETISAPHAGSAPARPLDPAPRRILVKEVNWLGDLVISLPALRAIRRAWPDAHLAVAVKRELASFFDGDASVDEVIPYVVARGIGGVADRWRIVAGIRSRRFDLAVLFPNSFESALWAAMAGVPRRAGFATDARGALLTLKATPRHDATSGHQERYWLAMIRATLTVAGDPNDFAIAPHQPSLDKMRTWLGARRRHADAPLVAIAPAAAYGPAKEWPPEHYGRLIDLLAERYGAESVLVGAPAERAKCERVAALSRSSAIVAADETSVGELIATLAIAGRFIGNDSGAMHLAGALGIPTAAIFGSTDPNRTGPMGPRTRVLWRHIECSPCLARTCRFGHYNCLREIGPEEAAGALAALGAFA